MKGWFQQYRTPKEPIGAKKGPNFQYNYTKKPSLKVIKSIYKVQLLLWHQAYHHLSVEKCKRLVRQPIYTL